MTKEQTFSALQSLNFIWTYNDYLLSLGFLNGENPPTYRSLDNLFNIVLSDNYLLFTCPTYNNSIGYNQMANTEDLEIWLGQCLSVIL
jgi:hypothetical protein